MFPPSPKIDTSVRLKSERIFLNQAIMQSWGSRSEYSPNTGFLPVCDALSFATGAKKVRKWAVDLVTLPLGELWEESRT